MSAPTDTWTGRWVSDRFGVGLQSAHGDVHSLVGLALRRNPRRAHLLVSTVLGKHVPADPADVHAAGRRLGEQVAKHLVGDDAAPFVLGFAETATGLGHCVAEALGAPYLHSTRRRVATGRPFGEFEEEHSHATRHQLLPEDDDLLRSPTGALVLVDDELSTGRTAMNTIAALHAQAPRQRYVVAALVDLRAPDDRDSLARFAERLGVPVEVVALATATITWPDGFAARAAEYVNESACGRTTVADANDLAPVTVHHDFWPAWVRESGRHGFGPADVIAARSAAGAVAARLGERIVGERVLVLGSEELMYAPLLIALALGESLPSVDVRFSSTSRSPVLAVDQAGYPIRTALAFASHDSAEDGPGPRFAYNIGDRFSDIVLVVDADADTPELHSGLVQLLRGCGRKVQVVVLPCHRPLPEPLRGPAFGSYAADEVGWLLTDLSSVALEAPVEEREEAIQSGGAHYAESLPIEYQPDEQYRALFEQALDESAAQLAVAVGVVTEILLAERGEDVVLASLARAGTPIGVLMRRWAQFAHGLRLPHYALSIVRGRGIDTTALRYLAAHHDSGQVVFVDGWTGKGAITRELDAAIRDANTLLGASFDPAVAVLADPGSCVRTFGTREDFLVPSACLNSTVSGLVSRTVLNPRILRPGEFHGAKFYAELAGDDVSSRFIDAVGDRFESVAGEVAQRWRVVQAAQRHPTFDGWAEVQRLSDEYDIGDVNLVKPGVGETTRVLLRRVPWLVLVRAGAAEGLGHIRLLAEQRGVPVREVPGLTYRSVGLIHPRFTRGATGADGRAVS